ncbi:Protein SERAC1 [Cocos nucifera]|uniref:Protein SERAC1 n=1 Tax=Cocos nucifera TaxID=13894 RepID=A0A8K0I337_COCNU|nr:Protein SERAC1 [Cocos nucifera]
MLRLFARRCHRPPRPPRWRFSSQTSGEPSNHHLKDSSSPPSLLQKPLTSSPLPPLPYSPRRSLPFYALTGTLVSSLALAAYLSYPYSDDRHRPRSERIYADLEKTLERSKGSVQRVLDQMKQTFAAAAVLWNLLASVLSTANQEVRSGFELRVAALLADISAANGVRRSAIVGAGGGAVVDWLLESVASSGNGGDHSGTQAEAARALAHLIADPNVCQSVLGRPHAIPNLLKFIFSFQPKTSKKQQFKHTSLDGPDFCKGRSMLVAALMDIITSNCDKIDHSSFQPLLPGNAEMRDIAVALEVVEQGGMHFHDHHGNEDNDDGDRGMRGIGIKVLGGTTVLGFSGTDGNLNLGELDCGHLESFAHICKNMVFQDNIGSSPKIEKLTSVTVPGLWDDLQREHVAVPFAAWALANWALASELNRSHIQELDGDGHAIMTALMAPERTVKWHGSLVARALLDDLNLPLTVSVPKWSSSLLSTAFYASEAEDVALARVALSAFLVSIDRSNDAKKVVMEKGLHLMRGIAKQSEKYKHLQEALARILELLYAADMHLSLEESQKWSGILLRWVFSQASLDTTRLSATKILSCILEDHGPASIPISQGWLTLLLTEILGISKKSNLKASTPLKTDKVKTQIDQSNAQSAAQVASQLATSVMILAGVQLKSEPDSFDDFPLADFLSIEPFAALFKNMKKNNLPKFDAADSAFATLKSIKALTELCSEDATCQNTIAKFGVLCLLRRFLLGDDYEKLAANETYDASRLLESQDRNSTVSGDSPSIDPDDHSSIRVPPTAHIRRHAARLLTILSLLPNIKKAILADEIWCKWLEDCASGKIPCCSDLKIQSYARATLLNVFCSEEKDLEAGSHKHSDVDGGNQKTKCPQYEDMIFLLNPELPYWKWPDRSHLGNSQDPSASPSDGGKCVEHEDDRTPSSSDASDIISKSAVPLLDVVFVHGLRGGPFKSWRIADNKSSTTSKSGLVENIDQEAGKQGTCWPREWLAADFPDARLFTVRYKEVSSMLLRKLIAAGIGNRPIVFVTHSMGGLVVKQMLFQAKINNLDKFMNNTIGVIGELRSGSPRLVELNDLLRHLHKKGLLETQVTPIVEGYGGWAFRMEVVPIESAYPGFGELVVLDATDHINSCKPVSRTDPSYAETLDFLKKLKSRLTFLRSAEFATKLVKVLNSSLSDIS